jgi:arylsulfatase
MKGCVFIFALALMVKANANTDPIPKQPRPNVIIVLSDDQGYGDFSCHGNPVLKTPALDRMFNESVRFSNFHVAPLCTPTRGQLMTGMDAMNNKASTVITGRGLMRRDITIMPEIFRQNGYKTGIFGKWHLGDSYPDRPMDRGFEKNIWTKGWGLLSESEYDNDYYKTRYLDNFDTVYSDKYCTDLWFDKAMDWMGELKNSNEPFFAYIPLNAPHGPFYSLEEDARPYHAQVKDSAAANFLGMVANIDRNMGRLDEWLIKNGLKENTIVIFMNDNGGTAGVKVYNAGMRGEKTSIYDGGHRAACFISGPEAIIGKARNIKDATEIQDLLPTFIDILSFKQNHKNTFDGKSLKPILQNGKSFKERMFVVQYTGKEKPEKYYSCVVMDDWRLVGENELYNITDDPGQQKDVASSFPDIQRKMKKYYEQWWTKLEPTIFEFVPVVIGSPNENPVTITSNSWAGAGGINTQWGVAQAAGNPRGGLWHLLATENGTYQLELSRWPFHIDRELTLAGPATAVGGTKLREGKKLAIAAGALSMDNGDVLTFASKPGDTKISMEMQLAKGRHELKAWFVDKNGKELCGAYYVRIRKL